MPGSETLGPVPEALVRRGGPTKISIGQIRQLRQVAVTVAHLDGLEMELRLDDGSVRYVRRDPGPGEVAAESFREAVAKARVAGSPNPVRDLIAGGRGAPVEAVLRSPHAGLRPLEHGMRWRRARISPVTDYLVTALPVDEVLTATASALAAAGVDRSSLGVWPHRDDALAMTLLACEWPRAVGEVTALSIDEALRDLAVIIRVRERLVT